MKTHKNLIRDETIDAYIKRFKKMQKYKFNEKGDDLFIEKIYATSEQIKNLYVKADVNKFEIFNDEPEQIGGTNKAPRPLETLLAAIANCLEISALLYLSFAKLKINSVKVKVEASFDKRSALQDVEAPFPGLYDLKYTWFIDADEDLKKIERALEKVADNCHTLGTLARSHKFAYKIVML